jgi:DtxR family transcriptional regulator, Mn-dependent transcriptional regulator
MFAADPIGASTVTDLPAIDAEDPTLPHVTHAMEDYLKAVYRLREQGGSVTTQRISEELGVTGPSVTNMVKRLHDLHLLEHERYQGVELTPAGERIALEVIRHHRLLELYLAETLGYSWDKVHAEAERLEHHLSDELEARIDSTLGHPTRDPHGDPIPSPEGIVEPLAGCPIGALPNGVPARITRVLERDSDRLRYLGDLGLYPGELITVVEQMPFEGPLRIRVGDQEHIIGRPMASLIYALIEGSK